MRVLHVFDHGAPQRSGYAARSAEIIRSQLAGGLIPAAVTSARDRTGASDTLYNVPCFRTPRHADSGRNTPAALLRDGAALRRTVRRAIAAHAPEIIHVHSPALNFFPAYGLGVPVVYEVRAFWEDAAVADGRVREDGLRYRLSRALETAACRRAAGVFTICNGLRENLLRRGISAERITIALNAVDPLPVPAQVPEELVEARAILQGKTVLGFFGSFYDYEGLDLLFEALPMLPPDTALLVIGQGPVAEALYPAAALLGGDRVQLLRPLPREVMRAAYDLCDLMVFPRRRCRLTDTVTPLKIPEAMCMGVPVAAGNVGGHRELIREGETGFLLDTRKQVTLAADLCRVLQQRDRRPGIAAAARAEVAASRTTEKLFLAHTEGYRKALRG